jgi:hypothetical protein
VRKTSVSSESISNKTLKLMKINLVDFFRMIIHKVINQNLTFLNGLYKN